MIAVTCTYKDCEERMRLGEGFSECELTRCICHATNLLVTDRRDLRIVTFPKYSEVALKKGDLIVLKHGYKCLSGESSPYYTSVFVGYGGKKPREENRAPIDLAQVVAVVRPGWRLSYYTHPADSVREALEIAWKNRL